MRRIGSRVVLCLALLWPALASCAEPEPPAIEDEEEYRVIAAVLARAEPEVSAAVRQDPAAHARYMAERPRLDGLGLGEASMTIQETTIQGQRMEPRADGSDTFLAEDYTRKNATPARLVAERLQPHLAQGQKIRLLTGQEMREMFQRGGGWREFRRLRLGSSGITSLSRVGFDRARGRAVVAVRHQADYEMGIGYRITLEKSAATGQWVITGAVLNYRS